MNLNTKKILALIPARGGSKGVKKKNIRLLDGQPLIGWTIQAAVESRHINKICISTDDDEIIQVCKQQPVDIIKRPEAIAGDTSPTIDAVLHVLDFLKKQQYIPDIVILLQCTSPFRTASDIDNAIDMLIDNFEQADSVISVIENEFPYQWLKKVDHHGYLSDVFEYNKEVFSRRQDFDTLYKPNGAIYIFKPAILLEKRSFITDKTIPYIMEEKNSLDIDTEWDFICAEALIEFQNKNR